MIQAARTAILMAGTMRLLSSLNSRNSKYATIKIRSFSSITSSASEQSEQDKLVELAHQLEGPMQTRGDLLKRYLAHTIAPVARKVKNIHNVLEEKVDVTFGCVFFYSSIFLECLSFLYSVAVLSFDDSCKKIEQPALRDEEELKRMYVDSQVRVKNILRDYLKNAYIVSNSKTLKSSSKSCEMLIESENSSGMGYKLPLK